MIPQLLTMRTMHETTGTLVVRCASPIIEIFVRCDRDGVEDRDDEEGTYRWQGRWR
jgi:hypothetical protein